MKETCIHIRVNIVEKELVNKKAKDLGMTVSDYIRYCCLINPPKKEEK